MNNWQLIPASSPFPPEMRNQSAWLVDEWIHEALAEGVDADQHELIAWIKTHKRDHAIEFMRDDLNDTWKKIVLSQMNEHMVFSFDQDPGNVSFSLVVDTILAAYFFDHLSDAAGRISTAIDAINDQRKTSPFQSEREEHLHFDNIDRARDMNSTF